MATLHQQRCFNHALREAVARCPECRRYYCRECVTEHESRLVCSACLAKQVAEDARPKERLRLVLRGASGAAAFAIIWFTIYVVGHALTQIPSTFHEDLLQGSPLTEPEAEPEAEEADE